MELWLGIATTVVFMGFGQQWFAGLANLAWYSLLFVWLFVVMLWLAFSVVRHAECLAARLGEPYGTLILTLSVISIEVIMITAVMLTGGDNPTLARDTMFAVLMIVLNGMVGLTLLLGGLRHREQHYNLQGANASLAVILTLSTLGLVLPRFTVSTDDGSASPLLTVFLILMPIGLYSVFLGIQTMRHRGFFMQPDIADDGASDDHGTEHEHAQLDARSVAYHAVFLLLAMAPIVILSKKIAVLIDHGIQQAGAPHALSGLIVAVLVLSPEGLSALRSALQNRLQRTVNICLGSAMATIGLTIPAVLIVGMVTGEHIELGLTSEYLVILVLTLLLCIVNFGSGRTNMLQGLIHLIVFAAYVVLIFD